METESYNEYIYLRKRREFNFFLKIFTPTFASITVPKPTVRTCLGTASIFPPKNLALAIRVSCARVLETREEPGWLKAMCPSGPIPPTKSSIPPADAIFSSYWRFRPGCGRCSAQCPRAWRSCQTYIFHQCFCIISDLPDLGSWKSWNYHLKLNLHQKRRPTKKVFSGRNTRMGEGFKLPEPLRTSPGPGDKLQDTRASCRQMSRRRVDVKASISFEA